MKALSCVLLVVVVATFAFVPILAEEDTAAAVAPGPSCPNNCNAPNQGTCQFSGCQCKGFYAGDDCSYIDQKLSGRGEIVQGTVPTFGWNYYYMQAHAGSELVFNINQTSTDGDCDLYIYRDAYPTRSKWIRRDISTKRSATIVLGKDDTSVAGKYYAGVYGFIGCSYNISGIDKGAVACPQDCSNHGNCTEFGTCICHPGWTGPACETSSTLPTDGTPVTGRVRAREWNYYTAVITQVPTILYINMTQTTNGDADLYVRYNMAPTLADYDALNITMDKVSLLRLEALRAGTYYIGVVGFWSASNPGGYVNYTVSLLVDQKFDCQNTTRCSDHGTCTQNGCKCGPNYMGKDCEERKTNIHLGQKVTGYVADSLWNYYRFLAVGPDQITITLNQTGGGDCDLYVRAGARPTQTIFDYVNLDQTPIVNITIPSPQDVWWHIAVFGWKACAYSLIVHNRDSKNCGHGSWDPAAKVCVCDEGWTGTFCDSQADTLPNGVIVNGTVTKNRWVYYTFQLKNSHSLDVRVRENNTTHPGSVWLFLGRAGYPDLYNYDKADTESITRTHEVNLRAEGVPMNGPVFLGVYGSAFGMDNQVYSYSIVAWAPDF